jgi:membrane fusion protein, heavy metal efflux system
MSTSIISPNVSTDVQHEAKPKRGLLMSAIKSIPNIIVFWMLAGVMYLGHHYGWKLPKMSELMGTAHIQANDWCDEHLVPESQCVECKTNLMPKGKPFGFCKEHGVMECVIHHPELAQVKDKPQLPKYNTTQAVSLITRPENNSLNSLHTRRVQFTSAESVNKSGIDVDAVQEHAMTESISANGELVFDPTHVAHLSSRAPGSVVKVFKTLGDKVKAGEILALVDAGQVGQLKSQLLQSIVQIQLKRITVDRLKPITAEGAIAGRSLIEAESALQEAEIGLVTAKQALSNLGFDVPESLDASDSKKVSEELRFLGIPQSLSDALPVGAKTANMIPIRAPYSGVIVASSIVAGESVDTSGRLFTIADPSQMWLLLNVRQEEAKYVHLDQKVKFDTDNGDQQVFGKVSWISPTIDDQTRTLQVRVAVSNSDSKLRDNTFGTGQIILREEPHAIVVPAEAIQSTSDVHLIFVRDKNYFDEKSPKVFHVRQVRIGAKEGKYTEVLAGVLPGEVIAAKGSNVLLAQLLRSNLGAGCACCAK